MKWLLIIFKISLLVSFSTELEDCMKLNKLIYEKSGNISITGIFDGHSGDDCSSDVYKGLEEFAAAIWTITALEDYRYLPGVKLGLSLFDACGSEDLAKKALIQETLYQSCHKNETFVGTLTTPEIEDKLHILSKSMNRTLIRLENLLDPSMFGEMIVQLLISLRWTTINRVIADNQTILEIFSKKTSDEGICVYDEVLISNKHATNNEILYPEHLINNSIVSRDRPVIAIMARSDLIASFITELSDGLRNTSTRWILLPTDATFDYNDRDDLPENAFVILPLIERKENLADLINNVEVFKDYLNHRETTKSPLFLNVASSILHLLEPFKRIQEENCPHMNADSKEPCPEVLRFLQKLKSNEIRTSPPKSLQLTAKKIESVLETLHIEASNKEEMFLYFTSLLGNKSEDLALFQIFDLKTKKLKPKLLIVNDQSLNDDEHIRRKRMTEEQAFRIDFDDIYEVRMQQVKHQEKTDEGPMVLAFSDTSAGNFSVEEKRIVNEANEKIDNLIVFENLLKHPCSEILKLKGHNLTQNCGVCQNLIKYYVNSFQKRVEEVQKTETVSNHVTWRPEAWVAINASIASVGLFCTLTVTIFLLVRMCRGDILEGSPYFSFLILLAITLIYCSILPFSFQVNEKQNSSIFSICDLRIVGPTLTYSILFSIMLARSLMLASSDQEGGFMSHVNGYLQTVLCFFMCGVQIALSTQYWLFNSYLNHSRSDSRCLDMYRSHGIIILLGYSYFLLLILMCISPFIFRSKRNYKEGLFFTIAIFSIVVVWSAWISTYFILPLEKKDSAVAFGLTATATTILASVFIPRTYLIMTAIVRYKIASTLPQLNCSSTADFSDINYRSNQALYDSVNVRGQGSKPGLQNPNFYSANPSDSRMEGLNEDFYVTNSTLKVNSSKMNDSVGSRRKIFGESRPITPENMYEAYNTPQSPKRVTKF